MVNKKFCLGMLLIVTVFGMTVVGCSDDIQIVAYEYAKGPNKVSIEIPSSDYSVIVQWSIVSNALSYDIYGQRYENNKNVYDIKHFYTKQATGVNDSEGFISISTKDIPVEMMQYQSGEVILVGGNTWRFGVTVTDIDKNLVPSKIVWSEPITIPEKNFDFQ